jgi:hypothetical protein
METGKETILNYCKQFSESSIDHIQNCLDNKGMIEKGEYKYLEGCPSSFGLDHFEGLCCEEQEDGLESQYEQCEECWKMALGEA